MVPKPGCSGRVRACVESVLVNGLMSVLREETRRVKLETPFLEVSEIILTL